MRRKKYLKIFLFIAVFIALVCIGGNLYDKAHESIPGKTWFLQQEQYISEFGVLADDMDNIVSMYLSGSISEQDFQNHLAIMASELSVMKAAYEEKEQEYPVKTGTHTYATKKGCEAVKECYTIFDHILGTLQRNSGDKDALSYKYLAYHQEIIQCMSEYMSAKDIVEQEDSDE